MTFLCPQAFLNQMSDSQLRAYAGRTAVLTARYGPRVFDTYGYANLSVHSQYARAAAAAVPGGAGAPAAFVTQPREFTGIPVPLVSGSLPQRLRGRALWGWRRSDRRGDL